jgi:hypothetical protein
MRLFCWFKFALLSFLFTAAASHISAQTQNAETGEKPLYRYFLLQAESLDEAGLEKLQKSTAKHEAIRVSQTCPSENQILFAVNASYPHRINAISDEIKTIFLSSSKKSGFRSIDVVPVSEITNFCK